jgi:UDP-glucose 4-epimerase
MRKSLSRKTRFGGVSELKLENRRVLVTGAAGFIGSHLVDKLLERDNVVVGFDNFDDYYTGKERNTHNSLSNYNFKMVKADILDFETLSDAMKRVEVVFHLAAQPGVRFSAENPWKTTRVNVDGTLNALVAARENDVERFVFASSSSVYGVPKYLPVDEEHPKAPISVYGSSKLAAEEYCRLFSHEFDVPIVILRYHTVYGPRQRPDMAIYKFTEAFVRNKNPVIFGDGSQTRDFTFVSDVIQGTIRAGEEDAAAGETVNIGSGSEVAVNELVRIIASLTGKMTVSPLFEESKKGDVPDTHADIRKAQRILGYQPKVSLEMGLREFVDWFLRKRGTDRPDSLQRKH